ncbi:hypothetical protein [Formosa maritima]|uniref:Uncharacterized protein n=1 Tax=Formosa maritima TaxID=2592046 RepID=A0A5D0GFU6_9FLAO|nr:hypothetical protein [Formosa maritima]TYA56677.1 hypothetical protein FVF61_05950 [Formosa maritima]
MSYVRKRLGNKSSNSKKTEFQIPTACPLEALGLRTISDSVIPAKAETCHSCESWNPLSFTLFRNPVSSVIPAKAETCHSCESRNLLKM